MKELNIMEATVLTSPNPLTLICSKKEDGSTNLAPICFVSYLSFNPEGSDIQIPVDTRLAMVATLQQSVEVGDHILHICQVDKFLGDEDKKGLYAWNGFGKVAPAAEG